MATRSQVISTSGRIWVEVEHEIADLLAADGVEPGHGLVQHHQLRFAHQGLRYADALEHALGKLAQGPAPRGRQAHALDEAVRAGTALGSLHIEQRTDQIEEFLGRQIVVEVRALGQVTQTALGPPIGHRPAQHLGATAGGKDQPHQHLQGGGLARAVGAEVAEDLAAPDLKARLLDRLDALAEEAQPEGLGQIIGAQYNVTHGESKCRRYQ
jgi:hypothetical protein